ncbi:hypothetical protein DFQ26_002129 [Actinomortierella ambigua]|nr:hypothetical protein DFQ26_002129 [Actinomortierella ambigua]
MASVDFLDHLVANFKRYGDYWTLSLPMFGRIIVVHTPECMEHILKTNQENYVKGFKYFFPLRDLLGNGIFVSNGAQWRLHRKTASMLFTTRLYRDLVQHAFSETAVELGKVLEQSMDVTGETANVVASPSLGGGEGGGRPVRRGSRLVDLQCEFHKLTLQAFAQLSFGIDFHTLGTEGSHEFGDAYDFMTAETDRQVQNPLYFIMDRITGHQRTVDKALATLNRYAYDAIAARRVETEEQRQGRRTDLLDHFIRYESDDGSKLSDLELRDVFMNFMIAGRDTTAQTLTWMFYLLMTHPRVQSNLRREIDAVFPTPSSTTTATTTTDYTYETIIQELPYAKAVFYETLRLYPPVPKNAKMVASDDVLPNGVRVKKGDFIGYSNYIMGRSPKIWGEDAHRFYPERWLSGALREDGVKEKQHEQQQQHQQQQQKAEKDEEKNEEQEEEGDTKKTASKRQSPFGRFRNESPFKFVAFNAGPRVCLGQTFATLEALVTTVHLLQRFEFKLAPGHPIPQIKGSATLPMEGSLLVQVSARQAAFPLQKEM